MNKNLRNFSSLTLSMIFVMSSFNGVFAENNIGNNSLTETQKIVRDKKEFDSKKVKYLKTLKKKSQV